MPLNAPLERVAADTAAATDKVSALVIGSMDALFAELGKTAALTPNMSAKWKEMRANATENIDALRAAAGL